MSNPNPLWARILRLLYDRNLGGEKVKQQLIVKPKKNILTINNLLGEDLENIRKAMNHMERLNLVESISDPDSYRLTVDGFHVAHQRALEQKQAERENELSERQKQHEEKIAHQQNRLNRRIVLLTGVLAIAAVVEVIVLFFS